MSMLLMALLYSVGLGCVMLFCVADGTACSIVLVPVLFALCLSICWPPLAVGDVSGGTPCVGVIGCVVFTAPATPV